MRNQIVKFEDVIGKTYNFMTVESEEEPVLVHGNKGDYKSRRWLFRCVCGNTKTIEPSSIISGVTKSCGCMKKILTTAGSKIYYESHNITPTESRLYGNYKSDAKKSGREFSLTKEDFITIVNSNCFYCGSKPFLLRGNKTKSVLKPLNGVDRKDNTIGYTTDNVVPCCIHCNKAKLERTISEFSEWVKTVYTHMNTKQEDDSI